MQQFKLFNKYKKKEELDFSFLPNWAEYVCIKNERINEKIKMNILSCTISVPLDEK